LKNIAKNIQPGSNFDNLKITYFSKKKLCSICAITLILVSSTEQNLQGVSWTEFSTTWQNKIKKIVNGGTKGDHTAGQSFSTINARNLCNSQTQIPQINKKFLKQPNAQNGGKIISKF